MIGPCSSDNEEAVMEYACRLADLQEQVKDQIFIVMRVYAAKPRTNGDGYKGSDAPTRYTCSTKLCGWFESSPAASTTV